ncbi:S26 family signal peptidase [Succinivibrio sp.]|uniref:S26 family signal peptidase n=2 Tax=Succinivibrio sp. TaxID=2053619 RepID=UPI00386C4E09
MFCIIKKSIFYLKYLLLLTAFSTAIFAFCFSYFSLYLNISDSIPKGLYVLEKRLPKKNELALFCLNKEFSIIAKERKYLSNGVCNGLAPIGKKTVAKAGDLVKINEFGTYVDNVRIKRSIPLKFDPKGELMPQRFFERILEDGEYIFVAEKIYSFDSRYFGTIEKENILGTIKPLFTYEKGHLFSDLSD